MVVQNMEEMKYKEMEVFAERLQSYIHAYKSSDARAHSLDVHELADWLIGAATEVEDLYTHEEDG